MVPNVLQFGDSDDIEATVFANVSHQERIEDGPRPGWRVNIESVSVVDPMTKESVRITDKLSSNDLYALETQALDRKDQELEGDPDSEAKARRITFMG